MFDDLVTATAHATGSTAVGTWARVENAACARRLSAMADMLAERYAADGSAEREQWYLDNWAAVSAHIGAAMHVTAGTASHQLIVASALRDRLPLVGEAFAEGLLTYQVVRLIVTRTGLVSDREAQRAVDAEVAEALRHWEPMPVAKAEAAVDEIIARHDPHAVRRTQARAKGRRVEVFIDDGDGMSTVWATLFAPDAKAMDSRLNTLAHRVCENDPRTRAQRRADAFGALARGEDRLHCGCGRDDCTAATDPEPTGSSVVYVVVNDDTLADTGAAAAAQDAELDGVTRRHSTKPLFQMTLVEALTPPPGESAATRPGALMGGHVLPGAVARRTALSATLRRVVHPRDRPPEPRYIPSRALADFVRCRDMTCRFPGCAVPASACDLDHTIPHPSGPTCASNLKALCRRHHLLKTFWSGTPGWCEQQHPDGTVDWTTPDGATYRTTPGSRVLFPSLCVPTAPVTTSGDVPVGAATGLTMPRRARTRREERARRIEAERLANAPWVAWEVARSIPTF